MYVGSSNARTVIRDYEFYFPKNHKKSKKKKSGQVLGESKQDRIKFDVLLTSYEMINLDTASLKPIKWESMVVDEGHRLKNKDSKLFSSLQQYSSRHRVLLTGTPLQNAGVLLASGDTGEVGRSTAAGQRRWTLASPFRQGEAFQGGDALITMINHSECMSSLTRVTREDEKEQESGKSHKTDIWEILFDALWIVSNSDLFMGDTYLIGDGEDKEYYVKWKELQYDECSWELESDICSFQQEIERFNKIQSRRKQKSSPQDTTESKKKQKEFQQYECSPEFLSGGSLHPYQLEGLNFLRFSWSKQTHVILADEMGLGKTIQSIAFLASLFEENVSPHLVVAPLSTLRNWEREFALWAPQMNVVNLGTKVVSYWLGDYVAAAGGYRQDREAVVREVRSGGEAG
nr:CHD3-type chromatin-remodeling factor PICKLE-like [Ipomoea batatas]